DEVELDRLPLARVADRRHPAFVGRRFFGGGLSRTEDARQHDRHQREPGAERDHEEDGEPALHRRGLVNEFPTPTPNAITRRATIIQPMRIAWFTPLAPSRSGVAAYSREVVPVLDHTIDLVDEAAAHDFVWKHQRQPYDLVVYQLGNAACHDYMWAYLVRYPGLVVLHDARLHQARARRLLRASRFDDYRAEFRYDHPGAVADF